MGLGKTIQAIALILTNPRQPVIPTSESNSKQEKGKLSNKVGKGTLVVAPLALIKQWEGEIKNRVKDSHSLRVCIHHGPQRTKRFEDLRKYDVVITTYNILVSEYGSSSVKEDAPQVGCFGIHWYRVILDEAHSIKNRNAKSAKAAYALRSEYRWCLTGTPMQNNLDELQSLIKFLRIKPYDELSVWKDQITRPLSQGKGGLAMKRLQTYLKVFMKRRTKDILKAEGALNPGGKPTKDGSVSQGFRITERVVEKIEVGFTPSERAYYERLEKRTDKSLERMMKDDGLSYMGALTLLLRLRQACNHSQLVKKSLTTDKDAITTGQVPGSQSAKKQTVTNGDVDEMADLLGGLSMESKQCDVCLIKLSKEEASSGMVRCTECEQDLADQEGANESRKNKKDKRRKEKAKARSKPKSKSRSEPKPSSDVRKNRTRQIIDDSDDGGEGEGEWLVGQDQQQGPNLGKAGGTEDEHAEGGGEWLASDDSETDDEVSVNVTSVSRKKTIRSSGSDTDSEEEEESFQSVDSSRSEATVEEDDDDEDDESDDDESEDSDASVVTHLAISTKIKHLIRILNAETPSHKFIVFSQFTSMLDLIEPFLKSANLKFTRYDGGMKNDLREASLERLRTDKNTRILLCSLKCGSLGLNLTAASRVVILEPFWNPFVEEQAIDRVHRLNQTVDVHVYKLTIANTVEERIFDLQEKKRALADAAIEGKGAAKLSMKDMLALFRRDAEHDMKHDAKHAELGTKTRVLGGISTSTPSRQDSMNSTGSVGARGVGYSQRVTPPIMERMMPNKPKEDSVYGRRW